jgi:DNA-binding beta-propeller fold protein YncE
VTIGQLPVGSNAFDPTGPQGMAYDAQRDILYVASTADNSIVAFPAASTATASFNSGPVVFRGTPLNAPVGLTLNPLNGNLIAVNQLDNKMVEIAPNPSTPTTGGGGGGGSYSTMMTMAASTQAVAAASALVFSGKLIATKLLDTTVVDAQAGTGSALFGVLAVKDSNNNLLVYYTNSNTNTLNVLKQ